MTSLLAALGGLAIIFVLAEAYARHILKNRPSSQHFSGGAPGEIAERFFRNTENIESLSLSDVFNELGQPRDCDDWDFGRLNYTWKSKSRCVRVYTVSDRIEAIHLIDPANIERFAPAIEVIWEAGGQSEEGAGKR